MSHIEVLEFELKALKAVLESQNMTLASYRRSYHHHVNVTDGSKLQARASASVIREYEQDSIPRTERHIAALEWALQRF